jgi:uncharacterized protein (DUF2267 family)
LSGHTGQNDGEHRERIMPATGLETFDKAVQSTDLWLGEIMKELGPDRHVAWHVLTAVLHALRDRLPIGLAVHLGAQLPLLIRGAYYDGWRPSEREPKTHTQEEFLRRVAGGIEGTRPVNVQRAVKAVFRVLNHRVDPNQAANVREALPEPIRALWPASGATEREFAAEAFANET